MLIEQQVVILGIPIPSNAPLFLALVVVHVLVALSAVLAGAIAMLSPKREGRHPLAGTIYYWSLALVTGSMAALSTLRWPEDTYLFVLGLLSFSSATFGRMARRHQWRRWLPLHMSGMGLSYILMLTAFYVDNGAHLPLWRSLPQWAYWVIPSLIGLPILVRALTRHPLVLRERARAPSVRDSPRMP